MTDNVNKSLFDWIAPVYAWFYSRQKIKFELALKKIEPIIKLNECENVIDIGCGTGALCAVLSEKGLKVTGIDPSQKMLDIAANKSKNKNIKYFNNSILSRLPFEDNHFDVSFSSNVAHGLKEAEREIMFAEMNRITRYQVVIIDYNQHRSILSDIIEWLEGGDYFNFINTIRQELSKTFENVQIIDISPRSSCYICM